MTLYSNKPKYMKNNLFWKCIFFIFLLALFVLWFRFRDKNNQNQEKKEYLKDILMVGTSTEIKNGFGMFGMGENTTNNAQVRNLMHEYLVSPLEIQKKGYYFTEYKNKLIEEIPKKPITTGLWKGYYEFNLIPNIKFHDGKELTNDDIIETLELNRDSQNEHSYFIDKFAKSDDLTKKYLFYIKFKNNKDLLNYHHLSKIPIISKEVKDKDPQNFRNIGLGSFKLTKFDPNTKTIELEFFSDYYQLKNNNDVNIKKIIIYFIPSIQTLYMNLEKGELDLILENIEQVYLEKMIKNKQLKLVENTNLNLTYIILNSKTLSIENRKSIVQEFTPYLKKEILNDLGEDSSYYQVVNVFSDNRLKGGNFSDQEFNDIILNDIKIQASKPNSKIRALFTNADETKNRFMNKFIEKLSNEKGFNIEKIQLEKNETIAKAKSGEFDMFCLTEYLENTFPHYLLNVYFGKIHSSNHTNNSANSEAYLNVSGLNEPEIYDKIDYLKTIDFNNPDYESKIKELHKVLIEKYIAIPLFQINKIRNLVRNNIEGFNMNIFGEINWNKIKKE
ncbi:MAG: ABC-type peptide/nickel transport system substrate-binding protein [Candidatus Phytoplasma cynodontis]|uniref:ABC transporter substrate-binding protein n=1 Tax='Cynodon dactylon' phytoplasma TaxID=295320 RepID=UPI001265B56C|nr:ABC transporter substrate-binding protein ['Cynodon dactylon' phytoplasma]KAB8121749.1 hypothetical protein F1741_01765 ['Cynodon dactylon' phytoplasma]WIA07757.1 MAG: ABC-type peptide/nickel transport system substrate-binding protein [Candidatus Phytoplasma cynodontis]